MAIILNPILKTPGSVKMNNSHSSPQVAFNFPDESNIVEILRKEDIQQYSVTLNSVIRRIGEPSTDVSVTYFFFW